MPVDPTISLNVTGGKSGMSDPNYTAGTAVNPLSTVSAFADVQNKLNQAKLFGQQNAARIKFGQIAANAPNMDAAVSTASKDPEIAPFIPDILNTYAGTMNSIQQYRGLKTGQALDALTNTLDTVVGGAYVLGKNGNYDTSSIQKLFQDKTKLINDPEIRALIERVGPNIIDGLTDELDKLPPEERQAKYVQNLFSAAAATRTLDALNKVAGAATQVDVGGKIQPGVQRGAVPTVFGPAGAFTPAGNPLTKTLPPQVTSTGGVVVGGGAGSGAPAPGAASNPFEPLESKIAGDGKPMVPKGYVGLSPVISRGTGTGGSNVLSPEQQTISQSLAKDFSGPEKSQYDSSVQAIGALDEMDRNVDNMARKGGLLTPGAFGDTRLAFGKAANTLTQAFGGKPVFDPSAVASGEDILKSTQRMGINTLQTMLGSQREAAETIKNMTEKGVPGLDNSVMGFKIVNASIKAAAQRQVELREFEKAWQADPRNQGNLTGAIEAFNEEHPASGYIDKALDSLGMDSKGFKSLADLTNAVRLGYVTEKQAEAIAKAQGFKRE